MSIIDQIYNGNYYPAEDVTPNSDSFREHTKAAEALAVQLQSFLTEEQAQVLDEYKTETALVTDLYNVEYYRAGVEFGVRVILEAIRGKGKKNEK